MEANNLKELKAIDKKLVAEGYTAVRPSYYGKGDGKVITWADTVRSCLTAPTEATSAKGSRNRSLPMLVASSGGENLTDALDIGTKGLGWMEWGATNSIPNIVSLLANMSPFTAAALKFNTDLCAGLGPKPVYRYAQYVNGNIVEKKVPYALAGTLLQGFKTSLLNQLATFDDDASKKNLLSLIADIDDKYTKWEKTNEELRTFLKNNNIQKTFLQLCSDQQMFGLSFAEIQLQKNQLNNKNEVVPTRQWTPKAIGIRYVPAHICRFERMDEHNTINYVYRSNRWLDHNYINTGKARPEMFAYPMLNPECPLDCLETFVRNARMKQVALSQRPTRFILPSIYPTCGKPYYPVPAWHSIFLGDVFEYLSTIVSDRYQSKKNGNRIGSVIYIHDDYLRSLYTQQGADGKKKSYDEIRNKIFDDINEWMQNRGNSGKPLIALNFTGPDGKEHRSWEIVDIMSNNKNEAEANQKELQEISSIVFFALNVDAKLIGNTPGDTSSGGGTEQRERFLLKQIQMSPTQSMLLRPFYVVSDYNNWFNVDWEVEKEVITTLDNSKTGLTEAETK